MRNFGNLKFIGIAIYFVLFCFFPVQEIVASTSCAGAQTVLGFSADWKQLYWNEEIAGECDPGNAIHVFDFEKMQQRTVAVFDYVDDAFGKDRYQLLREKIQKTISLPKRDKAEKLTCIFSHARFVSKESYLAGAEAISSAYFNPQFQYWVVISKECNLGNSGGSCESNGLYILDKTACSSARGDRDKLGTTKT